MKKILFPLALFCITQQNAHGARRLFAQHGLKALSMIGYNSIFHPLCSPAAATRTSATEPPRHPIALSPGALNKIHKLPPPTNKPLVLKNIVTRCNDILQQLDNQEATSFGAGEPIWTCGREKRVPVDHVYGNLIEHFNEIAYQNSKDDSWFIYFSRAHQCYDSLPYDTISITLSEVGIPDRPICNVTEMQHRFSEIITELTTGWAYYQADHHCVFKKTISCAQYKLLEALLQVLHLLEKIELSPSRTQIKKHYGSFDYCSASIETAITIPNEAYWVFMHAFELSAYTGS